ncbi:MAG: hypothetical protein K2I64_02985 [Muribaculaceae bacterium]|nr:hypothetical protein [Muribaculaceae bacterium]
MKTFIKFLTGIFLSFGVCHAEELCHDSYYDIVGRDKISSDQVYFGDEFKKLESIKSIGGVQSKDRMPMFRSGELKIDSAFFFRVIPAVGVLGKNYKRIDMYFYPGYVRLGKTFYFVRGRSKVKSNICDFYGIIRVTDIHYFDFTYYLESEKEFYTEDLYKIIGEYYFVENGRPEISGIFRGVWSADAYIDGNDNVLRVDDRDGVADGYRNRTFVGVWKKDGDSSSPKLCIWGDGRLPFTFDFDVGSGGLFPNEIYSSPEWESYISGEEVYFSNDGEFKVHYKNPWW